MHVDFGNCNPIILKKIMTLYSDSKLDISKIELN